MTTAGVGALHDLPKLVVGDLQLEIALPTDRKTIEIVVERDASLVLKAPPAVTIEQATQFVTTKRQWVYRKLAEKDALLGPPVAKQFVEGEGFAYLGRSYRLTLTPHTPDVRLDRGRFHLPAAEADQGAAAMRRWYTKVGTQWLQRRIRPWAARLGEQTVTVKVRDLGYRWGSARPTKSPQHVNIHWATLQLPPTLIDYILVHELAHLHETNHTPEFWTIVERLMPSYQTQKTTLAAIGKNIWLGTVTECARSYDTRWRTAVWRPGTARRLGRGRGHDAGGPGLRPQKRPLPEISDRVHGVRGYPNRLRIRGFTFELLEILGQYLY